MKTLIVHPYTEENDTEFLCGIYESIPNKTVIRGGITKTRLQSIPSATGILCD